MWQKATLLGSCLYLLLYSLGDSTRGEVGLLGSAFGTHILGEEKVVGGLAIVQFERAMGGVL